MKPCFAKGECDAHDDRDDAVWLRRPVFCQVIKGCESAPAAAVWRAAGACGARGQSRWNSGCRSTDTGLLSGLVSMMSAM